MNIADKLQNSNCLPPQARRTLVRYIYYTIKTNTVKARRRSRSSRTARFIPLVKCMHYL